ncbi:MAG TPA: type IV pilus assembly protein PilM [Acidimicrobiia bacterium]|jgi:type IV pilus assembly protein PilM
MARRLIGLDIGTNAVRVAEIDPGDPPRLTTFGQVALPFDAMRDGEVLEPAAITEAVQRLWRELSLKKGAVRIGVASPRVLVRTVDLPAMSDDELASALEFQAQELIPIPLDEAVLDFQALERLEPALPAPDQGEDDAAPPPEMIRVLLAAARRDTVSTVVQAVRAAGLTVSAVDLVPLALVRAIGRRVSDNGNGAEAIVSVGGGVTTVVVHEAGLPRFVRILGSGGRALTDAVARDMALTVEQAEALKRQGPLAAEEHAQAASAAMARPLADLVEQIRGSLDYYRTQPDAARILRVTLTGGAAQTPGLSEQLRELIGMPVDFAQPREHVVVGDIGFSDDQLQAIDPFLPVPIGLALGGISAGKRINLLGGRATGRAEVDQKRVLMAATAAGVVVIGLLGGYYMWRKQTLDHEKSKLASANSQNAQLQSQITKLQGAETTQTKIDNLTQQESQLLATDVSWSAMLEDVSRTIPNDVWLKGFTATEGATTATGGAAATTPPPTAAPATPSTGGAASGPSGSVSFSAAGLSYQSVADWLQKVALLKEFSNLWVPSATKQTSGAAGQVVVTFSSTASITSGAKSQRQSNLNGGS